MANRVRDWVAACLKMEVISYILLLYISRVNRYYTGKQVEEKEGMIKFFFLGMNKKDQFIKDYS